EVGAATTRGRTDLAKDRTASIDAQQAREEIERGDAALVDVRERHEWDESHLEGATLVPELTVGDRIADLVPDRSQRVVLYCRTDNRSARAADVLRELGYQDVAYVEGGIVAWEEAGLPVAADSGLTPEQRA